MGQKKEQKSDSTKKSEIRLTLFAIQVLHFISTAWANLPMGHNYNGKKSPSPFKVKIAKQRQILQRFFETQWTLFWGDNGNFGNVTSRILSLKIKQLKPHLLVSSNLNNLENWANLAWNTICWSSPQISHLILFNPMNSAKHQKRQFFKNSPMFFFICFANF